MARSWGSCDFKQLKDLQKKLEKLELGEFDNMCRSLSKELAARLLSKVIKRTPVGDYTGGGALRQSWTTDNQNFNVEKVGNDYQITIVNNMNYSSYVEYGHRTRGGKGWVEGQYFLTISEQELEKQAPKILEKKIEQFLKGALNG